MLPKSQGSGDSLHKNSMLGIVFCILSTLLDSFSGFFQLKPRKLYSPSPFMFMYVISFHTCYCALAVCLLTGEFWKAIHILTSCEEAWKDQVILTLTNVMGLVFIFIGLGLLGPIKLAFITTSRKAISVLASIVAFNKHIDSNKMIGIFLILSGMVAENVLKDKKPSYHSHANKDVHHTVAETGDQASSPKMKDREVQGNLKDRSKK